MLLYRMIGFNGGITFSFSKKGVMITAILFAIVYLLTYIYDLFQVQLANPIDLYSQEIKVSGTKDQSDQGSVWSSLPWHGYFHRPITTKNPDQGS